MEALAKSRSEAPVLLSNVEVLELIEKRRNQQDEKTKGKGTKKYRHRNWIEEQVFDYLKDSTPSKNISVEKRSELKQKLMASSHKKILTTTAADDDDGGESSSSSSAQVAGFGLTEAESVQILNFMPREPVDIHLMIEELHSRMTEKRQSELLDLIGSYYHVDEEGSAEKKEK
jgi:hypothetical protein